jgi:4-hydroxyphenylpyruvate dioxygenase
MVKESVELKRQNVSVEEIPITGFDHIEFYVGNALQSSYFFQKGLGFELVGYRGLETGVRDKVSYVMKQDHAHIILTGALTNKSDVAEHVHEHGDCVKSVGFRTLDAQKAFETAISRGAAAVREPEKIKDEQGEYVSASIRTYGDTIHTFVQRQDYKGVFAPGFKPVNKPGSTEKPVGLVSIDHIVGNCETGSMDKWAEFYSNTFGFHVDRYFDADDISTKFSALQSKVMMNRSGSIKMPLNEPAPGLRKSQIQEYLDYNLAEGVQHVAITTRDIIKTIGELRARGIEFITVPSSYYKNLRDRGIKTEEDMDELAKLGILIDSEDKGYLLQIFTKPVQDRPTFFFEVIQRKNGASGFGQGNFQALFEAIERDQADRGNL